MNIEAAGIILQLVIALVTVYVVYKRSKAQAIVDDSTAAINYQTLVVNLQLEVKQLKQLIKDVEGKAAKDTQELKDKYNKEINELKELLDHSDLVIEMTIQMLGAPVVKGYKWKRREGDKQVVVVENAPK